MAIYFTQKRYERKFDELIVKMENNLSKPVSAKQQATNDKICKQLVKIINSSRVSRLKPESLTNKVKLIKAIIEHNKANITGADRSDKNPSAQNKLIAKQKRQQVFLYKAGLRLSEIAAKKTPFDLTDRNSELQPATSEINAKDKSPVKQSKNVKEQTDQNVPLKTENKLTISIQNPIFIPGEDINQAEEILAPAQLAQDENNQIVNDNVPLKTENKLTISIQDPIFIPREDINQAEEILDPAQLAQDENNQIVNNNVPLEVGNVAVPSSPSGANDIPIPPPPPGANGIPIPPPPPGAHGAPAMPLIKLNDLKLLGEPDGLPSFDILNSRSKRNEYVKENLTKEQLTNILNQLIAARDQVQNLYNEHDQLKARIKTNGDDYLKPDQAKLKQARFMVYFLEEKIVSPKELDDLGKIIDKKKADSAKVKKDILTLEHPQQKKLVDFYSDAEFAKRNAGRAKKIPEAYKISNAVAYNKQQAGEIKTRMQDTLTQIDEDEAALKEIQKKIDAEEQRLNAGAPVKGDGTHEVKFKLSQVIAKKNTIITNLQFYLKDYEKIITEGKAPAAAEEVKKEEVVQVPKERFEQLPAPVQAAASKNPGALYAKLTPPSDPAAH